MRRLTREDKKQIRAYIRATAYLRLHGIKIHDWDSSGFVELEIDGSTRWVDF
jgi:hypothetical protein